MKMTCKQVLVFMDSQVFIDQNSNYFKYAYISFCLVGPTNGYGPSTFRVDI